MTVTSAGPPTTPTVALEETEVVTPATGGLTPTTVRILGAILGVGFVLRLAWGIWATRTPGYLESGDAYSYYFLGRSLADGNGYVHWTTGEATAYYPVGYPAILAVLFWFVQHTPIPDSLAMSGTLLNVAFATGSIALVFVITRKVADVPTALVAAALFALFPNPLFYVATMQIETAFIFLALAAVAVAVTHDWASGPPGRDRLLVFGAVLGVAGLVRPFALPFLVGVVLAVVLGGYGWRRALTTVGWVALPIVVLLTPWTIRNMRAMDSPVVFSTNLGDTACLDRFPGATGRFRWADHEGCVDPTLPEVERNNGNIDKAVDFVLDDPLREVRFMGRRFLRMMESDRDGVTAVESRGPWLGHRLRSTLESLSDWYFRIVGLLAIAGVAQLFRRRHAGRTIVVTAFAVLLLVPMLLWGNPRFHLPALPFFCIAAAMAITWVWRRATGERGAATPG